MKQIVLQGRSSAGEYTVAEGCKDAGESLAVRTGSLETWIVEEYVCC